MIASRILRAALCGSMAVLVVSPGALANMGRKALGEVTCFDGAYLEVGLPDGSVRGGAVAEDLRVKIEHRGHHARGRSHGNPSRGSLDDVAPGAAVLRMRVKRGVVDKLRLRASADGGETGAADSLPCDAAPADEDAAA